MVVYFRATTQEGIPMLEYVVCKSNDITNILSQEYQNGIVARLDNIINCQEDKLVCSFYYVIKIYF